MLNYCRRPEPNTKILNAVLWATCAVIGLRMRRKTK
jgi:hypothetical protein